MYVRSEHSVKSRKLVGCHIQADAVGGKGWYLSQVQTPLSATQSTVGARAEPPAATGAGGSHDPSRDGDIARHWPPICTDLAEASATGDHWSVNAADSVIRWLRVYV